MARGMELIHMCWACLRPLHGSWAHQNHGETFPKPFFSMLPGVRWFRQAAACYLTLCWDTIKEGIYVIEHLNFL